MPHENEDDRTAAERAGQEAVAHMRAKLLTTRENFIEAYRAQLLLHYAWSREPARLNRFMDSVRATIEGAHTWNADGDAVTAAWVSIGGEGKFSLKKLRALP